MLATISSESHFLSIGNFIFLDINKSFVFFPDEFHCPVTYKVFNENSHIVAIKTTGNVFAYEVCDELVLS